MKQPTGDRTRKLLTAMLGIALIPGAVTAVYFPTLSAPALSWDDDYNIWKNSSIVTGPWWRAWTASHYGMYIPMTNSLWALLYHLGAGEPWVFRLLNLLLHLINTALVTVILAACERAADQRDPRCARPRYKKGSLSWSVPWRVLLSAFFFALHPLQVATVAWISGARDLLAAFFALSAAILFFSKTSPRHAGWATALFLAGLLSKPSIVALPLALGIWGWCFHRGTFRRTAGFMTFWLASAGIVSLGTYSIQSEVISTGTPLWFRPLIALDSYGFFLLKILLPIRLAADYGRTPSQIFEDPHRMLWTLLTVSLILGGLIHSTLRRTRRTARERGEPGVGGPWGRALGWAWFALLLPVSGIVPFAFQAISTVADHYHYLPLAPVAVLFLFALRTIARGPIAQKATVFACALLIGAYGWASWSRALVWTDDRLFFSDMAEKNPDSYSAAMALGAQACETGKDFETGLKWIERGLEQRPFDPVAIGNRAFCLYRMGRYPEVYEMRKLFLNPAFAGKARNQDFASASLLASIGSAATQMGRLQEGLLYTCLAKERVPFEPSYPKNLEVIKGLLKAIGITQDCPPGLTLETLEK